MKSERGLRREIDIIKDALNIRRERVGLLNLDGSVVDSYVEYPDAATWESEMRNRGYAKFILLSIPWATKDQPKNGNLHGKTTLFDRDKSIGGCTP